VAAALEDQEVLVHHAQQVREDLEAAVEDHTENPQEQYLELQTPAAVEAARDILTVQG
jgi:hypothetical protein